MKKVLFLVMSITLTLSLNSCGGSSSKSSSASTYTSHYKSVRAALNDGSIYYGMTYNEIKEICGPADDVVMSMGEISSAFYGGTQLCFWNGRYHHYNY